MSVQTVFQSVIMPHPQCIKLSFYSWAVGERRPISVPVQACFMGDLLLLQFNSIVNMIYGYVNYLWTGSSIFPWQIGTIGPCNRRLFSSLANFHPSWQIKSAMFLRKLFFPPPPLFPYMTCTAITGDVGLTPRNKLHRVVWHVLFFPPLRPWYE